MDIHLIVLVFSFSLIADTKCSELMGGHYENLNQTNQRNADLTFKKYNDTFREDSSEEESTNEAIPDPSALIIPGYNLPEHLFNNGKPFYVEKDPLTGAINFNNKTPAGKEYSSDEYEEYDEPSTDIFVKSNIDRKDGGFSSHRPNDVNQLSPNFHDYLNLPVKYNPEKYVYPLISSSYANMKIQGNVNSYNHKQYSATTHRSTVSPTYYTTRSSVYYKPSLSTTEPTYARVTSTEPSTTNLHFTTTPSAQKPTKSAENLLNSPMNHPSYLTTAENEYDYDYFTTRESADNQGMYLTTEPPRSPGRVTYVTTRPSVSSTKKPYSIFDELFGDYDEPEPSEQIKPPSLFANLPTSHAESIPDKGNKIVQVTPSPSYSTTTIRPTTTQQTTRKPNFSSHNSKPDFSSYNSKPESISEVYPEDDNNMYEYEDDYSIYNEESEAHNTTNVYQESSPLNGTKFEVSTEKSVVVSIRNETKLQNVTTERNLASSTQDQSNFHQNFVINPPVIKQNTTRYSEQIDNIPHITTQKQNYISITSENYGNNYMTPKAAEKHTQTETQLSTKVTSMPLGENHPPNFKLPPIITMTQNLKESLNREKVEATTKSFLNPIPYERTESIFPDHKSVLHPIPSTSNIRIAPDQDMVSFVVGNHQNVDGHYIGSAVKEEPYISNSFRPLYTNQNSVPVSIPVFDQIIYNRPALTLKEPVNYLPQTTLTYNLSSFNDGSSTTIKVQPIIGSQASLSIGRPTDEVKTIPGQVVDEKLDLDDNIEYPKEPGAKIVFPEDDLTFTTSKTVLPNREILSLYSKPMYHQLPADLTPPSEPEVKPLRSGSPRPPWDPRPGHFNQGRPEYARPPRPHNKPEVYKRIDGLPNILPQFRPNAKVSNGHYLDSVGTINAGYMPRQPLLDRPSNRPIGFFEKLHPPPPPKRLHDLRKVTALEPEMKHDRYRYEERILTVPSLKPQQDHYNVFQVPPKVPVPNRKTEDEAEIATLQMIQAKQSEKLETIKPNMPPPFKINYQETTEKPLYVVYPVNSAPLKLDVLDNENRETVVVGIRGEQLPLPPSKINQEASPYEQKPLLKPKERNDAPILKPHSRPNTFPIKSDFPYILERPDPSLLNIPISNPPDPSPSSTNNIETTLSTAAYSKSDFIKTLQNNQWTSIESEPKIVNGNKLNFVNDPISATLKTYTEKPIAIAYTPTEPTQFEYSVDSDKFSLPNYGRPVISEIRSDSNPNKGIHQYGTVSNDDSEFTVSAVMHTHPQIKLKSQNEIKYYNPDQKTVAPILPSTRRPENLENHKLNLDIDTTHVPTKLDFQAPFHASLSVDSEYQGWSVVSHNSKSEIDRSDVDVTPGTNMPETSSEFDIENFKPQLFGGFKPIYNFGGDNNEQKISTTIANEREE